MNPPSPLPEEEPVPMRLRPPLGCPVVFPPAGKWSRVDEEHKTMWLFEGHKGIARLSYDDVFGGGIASVMRRCGIPVIYATENAGRRDSSRHGYPQDVPPTGTTGYDYLMGDYLEVDDHTELFAHRTALPFIRRWLGIRTATPPSPPVAKAPSSSCDETRYMACTIL